jgi:hypothetical protein
VIWYVVAHDFTVTQWKLFLIQSGASAEIFVVQLIAVGEWIIEIVSTTSVPEVHVVSVVVVVPVESLLFDVQEISTSVNRKWNIIF